MSVITTQVASSSNLNNDTAATPNTGVLRDGSGSINGVGLNGSSVSSSGGFGGGVTQLTATGNIASPNSAFMEVTAGSNTTQTVTASASAFAGKWFWLVNVGTGTVTIAGVTGITSLAPYAKAMIYSDGTTWYSV